MKQDKFTRQLNKVFKLPSVKVQVKIQQEEQRARVAERKLKQGW